ncbi:MAG: hypothetical protein AAGH68_16830 [Pseudomonadota bacterium]
MDGFRDDQDSTTTIENSGALDVVLRQDQCFQNGVFDDAGWLDTVFLPFAFVSDGKQTVSETEAEFEQALRGLEGYLVTHGAVRFSTRVQSQIATSEDIVMITAFRDSVKANEELLLTASMTFMVIRTKDAWRVCQIHFNDHGADVSAMTRVLRARGWE